MKKILVVMILAMALFSSGCSAVMVVKQPDKKNLDVLEVGTHKDAVRAELGVPISTGAIVDGEKSEYDVFGFSEGNSKGWGVGRALLYGILDVFTFGLWEVVGTPIEGSISGGSKRNIRVLYSKDKVVRVEDLTPQPKTQ